ncbi:MAG: hypothetical protein ACOY0T_12405 [Myxococcota bacterium]
MPTVVTSKHLQGTTELTLIADIKPGLVPVPDPMSYAFRLRRVLEFLFLARKSAVERYGQVGSAGPLERLRMLHFVHWSIHDNDRKLLLAVSFDGAWEPYIRAIVEDAGPILDIIFSHCEGYAGHSCYDGYEAFAGWVREHQINCDFFYAGAPDVTVDDIRYLQDFERGYANGKRRAPFEHVASKLRVGDPLPPQLDPEQRKRLLAGLFGLRGMFPAGAAGKATSFNDAFLYGRVAALLTREVRLALAASGARPSWFPPPPQEPSETERAIVRWASGLAAFDPLDRGRGEPEVVQKPHEVQGNVLSAYPGITHGCVLLGRFEGPGAALDFIQTWKDALSTEERASQSPFGDVYFNLALTPRGLGVLGMAPDELARFPKEFQEGLAARAGVLGDVGRNHPARWALPRQNWPKAGEEPVQLACVDFAVILQRSAPAAPLEHRWSDSHPLFKEAKQLAESRGIEILHVQPLCHYERGHFGLIDGKSQPHHRGSNEPNVAARDRVALGELLLGYENDRGEKRLHAALPAELIENSTFLVMRQMALDVPGFHEAVSEAGNSGLDEQGYIAKVLGRNADGSALLETGETDNDFDYQNDPHGAKCPLFSHVRRANPRTKRRVEGREVPTPRIVRRGLSYGPLANSNEPSSDERGLLFMAYCASIADQYEVVQRWVNGGNSSGALSGHADPLAGNYPERNGFERLLSCVHEGRSLSIPLPQRPLAQLKWGLYLFVPSVGALEYLIRRASTPHSLTPPSSRAVLDFLHEMRELESLHPQRAALAWKVVLEDRDQRLRAAALWEHIRQNGGALRTAYGVLVGSAEGVRCVLAEHRRFSVRRYWARMEASFGVHYLGMDPEPQPLERACPVSAHRDDGDFDELGDVYPYGSAPYVPDGAYERVAAVPNQFALEIDCSEAYSCAFSQTKAWLEKRRDGSVDLRQLAREVIYDVARILIGTPEPPKMDGGPEQSGAQEPARCPLDFQRVSQFIFHPRPSVALSRVAQTRGKVVLDAITAFVSDTAPRGRFSKFFRERILRQESETTQYTGVACDEFELYGARGEASALTGLINGFAVPTSGSFLSVMNQWCDSEEVYRLQRWLLQKSPGEAELRARLLANEATDADVRHGTLFNALVDAMMRAPVPDLLHRVATGLPHPTHGADDEIEGVLLSRGDRVVVSLSSAAVDARRRGKQDFAAVLFGGDRDALDYPVHACPGQKMAFGVLLGMIVGILSQRGLTISGPLSLRFKPS